MCSIWENSIRNFTELICITLVALQFDPKDNLQTIQITIAVEAW
jgi:hypothetical protein